jgi:hypothetical protein
VILLALLPTYEPVPETTSALDPGHQVASAIATARIFLVKIPAQAAQPPPADVTEPPADDASPTTLVP